MDAREEAESLLPDEVRKLRELFAQERIVEERQGQVIYEVDADSVDIERQRPSRFEDKVVIVMRAKGVSLSLPVNRAVLKRLKREFEMQERLYKRRIAGESPHKEMITKHNFITYE